MKRVVLVLTTLMLIISVSGQGTHFKGKYLYQDQASRIFAVSAADIDGDSLNDILFTEPDSPHLAWLRNLGNGQFDLKQAAAFKAIGTVVLDMDGDGNNDIIACSYDQNMVILLKGDGSGNFIPDTLSSSVQHPLVLSAGDADGDGDTDISVATQDAGTGAILLVNDGSLHFTTLQLDAVAYSSTWTRMTDLDLDGKMDVLAAWFNDAGGIIWYRQLSPLVYEKHFIPCPAAHGADIGDIDGDGDTDLAIAACGYDLAWLENDGNCNFSLHYIYSMYSCAVSAGIADLDGDSLNDIAVTVWGSNRIEWWKNGGSGNFSRTIICDSLLHPSDLCKADINSDGKTDIVTGSYAKKLAYFENTGQGMGLSDERSGKGFNILIDDHHSSIRIAYKSPECNPFSAEVFNSEGRLIMRKTSDQGQEILLSGVHEGFLIIRILSGENVETFKTCML
jgi:hypothetical protein